MCGMEGTWDPRLGRAGDLAHLELDGEFVGAKCEAGGEEHSTLLLGDRFSALPLTPLDFLQKLQGGVRHSRSKDRLLGSRHPLQGESHGLRTPTPSLPTAP